MAKQVRSRKNVAKKTTKRSTRSKERAVSLFADLQMERDFRDALLIVSLIINVIVLSLWVAVKTTDVYDTALIEFFFNR